MMSMWQFKRTRTHLIILNNIKYISYIIICHIYILHYITQTSVWVSMFGFLKGGNDWSIDGESLALGSHPWPWPWLTDGLLERSADRLDG
jgi:hypothetical protein